MDGSWDGESVLKLKKCKDSAASASHIGAFGLFSLEEEGDEEDIHLTGGGEATALALTALVQETL